MDETLPNQSNLLLRFIRLAIANVLSIIMVPLANLMSVVFLGHLSEVQHLAGVALAGNVLNVVYFTLSFLRMSTTGVTAQAVGRNDRESMLLVALRNGLVGLVLGLVIMVLQYPIREIAFTLRSAAPEIEASAIAYFNAQVWCAPAVLLNFVLIGWLLGSEQNGKVVLISAVGSIANIALDYLFIVRWGWESTGAGISYATSQYLTLLVGLIFLCLEIRWQELVSVARKFWDISAFKSTFTLNGNIFVSNFLILFSFAVFHSQSSLMGTNIYAQNALMWQIFILSIFIVEGIGYSTETLGGNFKGQGVNAELASLLKISVGSSVLVGLSFAGVSILFPQTVFGLFTNHKEVIESIDIYVPWLLLTVGFGSIAFSLHGYFVGLAEGHTLRNASLIAILVGFTPTMFAASQFHSNHLIWLAVSLFLVIQTLVFGIQLPRTLRSDYGDGRVSPSALKEASGEEVLIEKLEVAQDEKSLVN